MPQRHSPHSSRGNRHRADDGWQQTAQLSNPNALDSGSFGWQVAIDGNTEVVGTRQSHALTAVFTKVDGSTWRLTEELPQGGSIDLDGDTLVVDGRAVYRQLPATWQLISHFSASTHRQFTAAQLSGGSIILGMPQEPDNGGESRSALVMELPAPLCFHDGQCLCNTGAAWRDCSERPTCGDAIAQTAEDCDDGNQEDGDGCFRLCTVESNSP